MPIQYFPAVIDRSASGFGVSFPDFPGCVAAGGTVQAAAVNAEAALALHLEGMGRDDEAIPAPSSLDDIDDVEGADDVARILVRAELPGRVTRVLLSLDENIVAAVDAVSPNRSAFIADAVRDRLERQAKLSFYSVKARQVYVMQLKGRGDWRIAPHWSEELPSGRVAAASTILPDKFGTKEEAVEFASRTYGIPQKKVVVRPTVG